MKTKEELTALKEEVENLNRKLRELTEDELEQVAGGYWDDCKGCPHYGRSRQCIEVQTQRHCPKGHRVLN